MRGGAGAVDWRSYRSGPKDRWAGAAVLAIVAAVVPAGTVAAQSALDRPPSLNGAWVGEPGVVHFHFIHRFTLLGDVNKVVNAPSFLLGTGLPARTLAGLVYASNSDVSPEVRPNEWELFGRWQPVGSEATSPLRLTVQVGYNTAVGSVDGELAGGGRAGPASLFGALRVLSDAYGADEARIALGAGALVRLGRWVAVGGDVASLAGRAEGEKLAWSAGLLLGIPYSPHSLSLHATNVGSGTLQGSSRGGPSTHWGFEFTVPVTLERYFGGRGDVAKAAPPPPGPVNAGSSPLVGDTVHVAIDGLEYVPARLEVTPGTTVVWTNRAPLAHTVTANDGTWGSPSLDPDDSWGHTFTEPGEYAFHCAPHPFMVGVVVVRESATEVSTSGPGPRP